MVSVGVEAMVSDAADAVIDNNDSAVSANRNRKKRVIRNPFIVSWPCNTHRNGQSRHDPAGSVLRSNCLRPWDVRHRSGRMRLILPLDPEIHKILELETF